MSSTPHLSDAEIADICDPLVSAAAQRRYLASLGLVVRSKPNGRPLVARAEFERVLVGRPLTRRRCTTDRRQTGRH
jgi:hypothetical protein